MNPILLALPIASGYLGVWPLGVATRDGAGMAMSALRFRDGSKALLAAVMVLIFSQVVTYARENPVWAGLSAHWDHDDETAVRLLRPFAEAGVPNAMLQLSVALRASSKTEADHWLQEFNKYRPFDFVELLARAGGGESEAQYKVGMRYWADDEYENAYTWLSLAASGPQVDKGEDLAGTARNELIQVLTSEETIGANVFHTWGMVLWNERFDKLRDVDFNKLSEVDFDKLSDFDRNGAFSISDVGGWLVWALWLPGDTLFIAAMRWTPEIARFFELDPGFIGGTWSLIISICAWLMVPVMPAVILSPLILIVVRVEEWLKK